MNAQDWTKSLAEKGFVKLDDFFRQKAINDYQDLLLKDFEQAHRRYIKDIGINNLSDIAKLHELVDTRYIYDMSMSHGGAEIKNLINTMSHTKIIPMIESIFKQNAELCDGGNVISVYPYNVFKNVVGFHQDDYSDSKTIRIHALINISNDTNDLFQVISGSHLLGNFKHSMFAPYLRIESSEIDQLKDQIEDISLNKGDLFLFNTRLIHRLKENHTDRTHWISRFIFSLTPPKMKKENTENDSNQKSKSPLSCPSL